MTMKYNIIDVNGNLNTEIPSWVNKKTCLKLYKHMLLIRKFDEKAIYLQKVGKLRLYPSSLGQEAIGAAVSHTLSLKDIICPYYRDQGLVHSRGQSLHNILLFWSGDERGNIIKAPFQDLPMAIPVASQCSIGAGIAYATKFKKEDNIILISCGDGATSKGDFYEAINFASIHSLPIIFLINNNQWAISTNIKKQTNCKYLSDKSNSFNIEGITTDGNDVFSIISAIMKARNHALENKGPTIIEAITYRLAPHTTSDNANLYRNENEIRQAWENEPLKRLRLFMLSKDYLTTDIEAKITEEIEFKIAAEIDHFLNVYPEKKSNMLDHLRGISNINNGFISSLDSNFSELPINMVEALNLALDLLLKLDQNVVLIGEDIGATGGVFRVTKELQSKYGTTRVLDFPIAESLLCGSAIGMSLANLKPIVEIQFFGFCYPILDHLINHATRYRNRTRGQRCCPIIFRIPFGGNIQAPEHHGENLEAIFAVIPGLKVVIPSSPQQAFGLLVTSYYQNDPVVILEHIKLYRYKKSMVDFKKLIPLDKAFVAHSGSDISIIAWGFQVQLALSIADQLSDKISIEVIDLCSIHPLDIETLYKSLSKTKKGIILQESPQGLSIASEIIASIHERNDLNEKIILKRISPPQAIVPYAKMEEHYFPTQLDIKRIIYQLLNIKEKVE
jgi:2-oxoisovalerate dehydrogenase E1 component